MTTLDINPDTSYDATDFRIVPYYSQTIGTRYKSRSIIQYQRPDPFIVPYYVLAVGTI